VCPVPVAVKRYRDFWTRSGAFQRYTKFPRNFLTKQNTLQIQKNGGGESSHYYEHVRLKMERNIKIDVRFLSAGLRHEIPRTAARLASNPLVSNSRVFSTTDAALSCSVWSPKWPRTYSYVRLSVIHWTLAQTSPCLLLMFWRQASE
jgi:hypothetical protein